MSESNAPWVAAVIAAIACFVAATHGAAAMSSQASAPRACSLVDAAQARSILGYPVTVKKGETDENCVLVSVPLKLDPDTLSPLHPSVDFAVFVDGTHARPFSVEIAVERKHPFVAVSGLGPLATLVPGPYGGSFGIFAKVGRNVIQLNVGPAKHPVSRAQGIRLARAIAARL